MWIFRYNLTILVNLTSSLLDYLWETLRNACALWRFSRFLLLLSNQRFQVTLNKSTEEKNLERMKNSKDEVTKRIKKIVFHNKRGTSQCRDKLMKVDGWASEVQLVCRNLSCSCGTDLSKIWLRWNQIWNFQITHGNLYLCENQNNRNWSRKKLINMITHDKM